MADLCDVGDGMEKTRGAGDTGEEKTDQMLRVIPY